MKALKNKGHDENLPSIYKTTCSQLKTKLQEIFDRIDAILKNLIKEKMEGLRDPKIVLASNLRALAGDITVWMNSYSGKIDKNKTACLFLAPASYKEQMEYIYKTCSEPDLSSKLSNQLKKDLSLLLQLFDQLYHKDDLERIKALNDAYASYLKRFK